MDTYIDGVSEIEDTKINRRLADRSCQSIESIAFCAAFFFLFFLRPVDFYSLANEMAGLATPWRSHSKDQDSDEEDSRMYGLEEKVDTSRWKPRRVGARWPGTWAEHSCRAAPRPAPRRSDHVIAPNM